MSIARTCKNTCKNIYAFDRTKVDDIVSNYNDVFHGIGKIDGEFHLHWKNNAVPTAYPARRILSSLREKLEEELNRMKEQGLIEKISKQN